MDDDRLYPWLRTAWSGVQRARAEGRLPHALLLWGPAGVGKSDFAHLLARSLHCAGPDADGLPCGACDDCRLWAAGGHPDFHALRPEAQGKPIKVDPLRELCAQLAMSRHQAAFKLALIEPAEAMNVNAANSFLKTLEEPTDNTVILLVSAAPARLPATIRSRCQALRMAAPEPGQALAWLRTRLPEGADAEALLELADGAPLRALALHEQGLADKAAEWAQQLRAIAAHGADPLPVAAEWLADAPRDALYWLHGWLRALIRRLSLGQPPADGLQPPPEGLDWRRLFGLLDRVARALDEWATGLNRQLMLEQILIDWRALWERARRA